MSEQKDKSVLINDLKSVPGIISSLGLGVAAAQKALDLNYLQGLEKIILLAKSMLDKDKEITPESRAILMDMVKNMAPARYHFTESSITVKMDLAQSIQSSTAGSFGVSAGAIAVNAAFTQAFAYDYRAAAEVKVHLHACSLDANVMNTLLERAEKIDANNLTLPADMPDFDKALMAKSAEIYKILNDNQEPTEINEETAE